MNIKYNNNLCSSIIFKGNDVKYVEFIQGFPQLNVNYTIWAKPYTLTINNTTGQTYTSPVITDTLDTTLVTFVPDSVTINGSTATSSQYTYNNSNGLLTVNLSDIATGGTATVTFKVTKNN